MIHTLFIPETYKTTICKLEQIIKSDELITTGPYKIQKYRWTGGSVLQIFIKPFKIYSNIYCLSLKVAEPLNKEDYSYMYHTKKTLWCTFTKIENHYDVELIDHQPFILKQDEMENAYLTLLDAGVFNPSVQQTKRQISISNSIVKIVKEE